jgi:hypothetical protein
MKTGSALICDSQMNLSSKYLLSKFFVKEGLTPNEVHLKFMNVYG